MVVFLLHWSNDMKVAVPAAYTSQTCSVCQHVHKDNRQTQSNFTCVACGHHEHADVNAAKNI
jgi:putative transposase